MKREIGKTGIAVICFAFMIFGMAACGNKNTSGPAKPDDTVQSGQESTEEGRTEESDDAQASVDAKTSSAEDFTYEEENGELTITGYTGDANVIVVPDSIAGKPVTAIGEGAFASNSDIMEVTLPDSVRTIGYQAFFFCKGLKTVNLGKGLQEIGAEAFYLSNVENAVLPESLTTLGDMCFNNTKLAELTIPPLVTEIGEGAFCGVPVDSIVIPGTVKIIEEQAFEGCDCVTVVIEEGVEVVGDQAFHDCKVLESITFPASITEFANGEEDTMIVWGSGQDLVKVYVVAGSEAQTVLERELRNSEYYEVVVQ